MAYRIRSTRQARVGVGVDRSATLNDTVTRNLINRKAVNPDLVICIQTDSVSKRFQSLSQRGVVARSWLGRTTSS